MAKPTTADTGDRKPGASLLGLVQAWLPVLTVVIGAAWGLWTYLDDQRSARAAAAGRATAEASARAAEVEKENRARTIEAQKPFLDAQLKLYFETAQVVGRLVQIPKSDPRWANDRDRFWELYWAELAMVEHRPVETAMVGFGRELRAIENGPADIDRTALQNEALRVAHALRDGIQLSWGTPQSQIVAPGPAQ